MSTLLDYDDLCQRYGLSRRYVRDTLTKRPGFPAPAMRLSQRLVRSVPSAQYASSMLQNQ